MISEQIVKQEFLSRTLLEEAEWIAAAQQKVISKGKLFRTRALYESLRGFASFRSFGIDGGMLKLRYLSYMRFLDIKAGKKGKRYKYSGLHLYNRIVFGRVYGTTVRKLMYGFTEDIKNSISAELQAAADALNPS